MLSLLTKTCLLKDVIVAYNFLYKHIDWRMPACKHAAIRQAMLVIKSCKQLQHQQTHFLSMCLLTQQVVDVYQHPRKAMTLMRYLSLSSDINVIPLGLSENILNNSSQKIYNLEASFASKIKFFYEDDAR